MRRLTSPRLSLHPLESRTTPALVGGLDPTFDGDGKTVLFSDLLDEAQIEDVVVQSDGKIVLAGHALFNGDDEFVVARLNPDGTPDETFDGNGLRVVAFDLGGANQDRGHSAAIDDLGRIVVVGDANGPNGDRDVAVVRLNSDGSLDMTFDGDGRATIPVDEGTKADVGNSVVLDQDGKIVIGGFYDTNAGDRDFLVVRLNTNGTLDNTFDGNGLQDAGFDVGGSKDDIGRGVTIDADNRIVVVGTADTAAGGLDNAVVRLNPDGSFDNTLDGDGRKVVALNNGGTNDDIAAAVAISDGKIVIVGDRPGAAGDTDIALVRLNDDGSFDNTFDGNGRRAVVFDLGGDNNDFGRDVIALPDGRLVVAGFTTGTDGDTEFAVARLNPDGSDDPSFGNGGRVSIAFDSGAPNDDLALAVAVQPNGRIVAVGRADDAVGVDSLAVARLIGGLELSDVLTASGTEEGTVRTYLPSGTGTFAAGPLVTPFPGTPAAVRSAVADVNGDGSPDIISVAGPGGGSLVRVVDVADGTELLAPTPTFEDSFTGGLFVAAADLDGDGRAEIVVSPDVGGGGRVQVFSVADGQLVLRDNFFGIEDPDFRGGARVALGDVNADGFIDLIVAAGFGGGPRVSIYDGTALLQNAGTPQRLVNDFFAFDGPDAERLRNGVFVSSADVTGDGFAELVFGGGPGGGPRVLILDGSAVSADNIAAAQANPVANFFVAGDSSSRGGVRVAVKDTDGDAQAELIVGSGEGLPSAVRVYNGTGFPAGDAEPAADQDLDPFAAVIPLGVFVG